MWTKCERLILSEEADNDDLFLLFCSLSVSLSLSVSISISISAGRVLQLGRRHSLLVLDALKVDLSDVGDCMLILVGVDVGVIGEGVREVVDSLLICAGAGACT